MATFLNREKATNPAKIEVPPMTATAEDADGERGGWARGGSDSGGG